MKTPQILIINGPNLNLLGRREPTIYGSESFDSYFTRVLAVRYPSVSHFQSNHEGAIIDQLHLAAAVGSPIEGIVINAGAYTHTSLAIADAIRAIALPAVEVHLSNIFAREEIRHHSLLAPHCLGSISGLGLQGYLLAIEAIAHHLATHTTETTRI